MRLNSATQHKQTSRYPASMAKSRIMTITDESDSNLKSEWNNSTKKSTINDPMDPSSFSDAKPGSWSVGLQRQSQKPSGEDDTD